jgi:ankyrin repeat protein
MDNQDSGDGENGNPCLPAQPEVEVTVQADNFGLNSVPTEIRDSDQVSAHVDGFHQEVLVSSDQRSNCVSGDGQAPDLGMDSNHLPGGVLYSSSGASSANADGGATRQTDSPTNEHVLEMKAPSFRKRDGTFGRVPFAGTSERRLLPAPGSLDNWANSNVSRSLLVRNSDLVSNEELHGLVSSALAHGLAEGGRSPMLAVRGSSANRSPSFSPTSGHSPSESPKGPRSASSSISHPFEELLVASTQAAVKPSLSLTTDPRSFKWSPSTSRGSSVSPKLSPVKADPALPFFKNIPQLDCSGEDYASQHSSESNGTGDGRTHRSTAPRRGARRTSPEGRSPKRRARRNSASPNRSMIASPHAAARFGNLDALKRLLLMLGVPDLSNSLSFTCLHMAASYGHSLCVDWLLSNGAGPEIDRTSEQGWTALHLACRAGHHDCAQLLLTAGAAYRCIDKHGRTPLHLACVSASVKCVQALIARDSDVVKDVDNEKWSCVHYATRCNNADILLLVLNSSADPNLADHDGWTALHNCSRNGQRRCAELLLTASANPLCTTRHLETPLHVACRCSKAKIIIALLEAAVKMKVHAELVMMIDHKGYTALMSCSNEDVRKQFEQKLATLVHQPVGDLRKSLSLTRDFDKAVTTQKTGDDSGKTSPANPKVPEGFSCAPTRFCVVM